MTASTNYGATLLCFITIFFITQVHPQSNSRPTKRFFVNPSCCPRVSNATFKESVNACFEQKENMFVNCKKHAYIFTKNENAWCVDPRAPWLPKRLARLARRGIYCKTLTRPGVIYINQV